MVVICKYCNKEYASYASRSNHIKKYHTKNIDIYPLMSNNCVKNTVNKMSNKSLTCQKCSKEFNNRQARWSHEKKCNIDNNDIILLLKQQLKEKDDKFKEETNNVKKELEIKFNEQLDTMKKQMLEIMNKVCKIHPKTLTKINKQLNINNINNDNKVINNNYIIQLGREKLCDVFSKKEKMAVLKQGYNCLPYLIEYTHFNDKFPQFKNILITNTQNNIGYKYNEGNKNFDAITKDELLNDIISERSDDICNFNVEYKECLSAKEQTRIDEVINKILNSPEFDEEQKKQIKFIIYNNRNKVSKEVTQDLEIII